MTTRQESAGAVSRRTQEASEYAARHSAGGEFTSAEVQEWVKWLADPQNAAEYDEIIGFLTRARALPPSSQPTAVELEAAPRETAQSGVEESEALPVRYISTGCASPAKWRRAHLALAAGLLTLGVLAYLAYGRLHGPIAFPIDPGQVYVTAPGERRLVELSDGSRLTLTGDTRLETRFSARLRTIILKRGEVLFQVERNPQSPFQVLAGTGKITALGTEFDVGLYPKRTFVTVMEGVVEVGPRSVKKEDESEDTLDNTADWVPVRVEHGHQMHYDPEGNASAARPVDAQAAIAWVRGHLVYHNQAFWQVVDDLERSSGRRIELDPAAAELPYTGMILPDKLEQWFRDLPKVLPVEITEKPGAAIIIRSRVVPGERPQS